MVATLVATLTRLPIGQADGPFYASIARSFRYGMDGVPSMLLPGAPTAVDHLRFYGPVYFRTVDLFFRLFGVSVAPYRAVGLLGVLLFAAAGVYVCKALGGGPERRAWTWLLLLLTPEVGSASSSGRMDSLAVGLELCGFAVLLDGIVKQKRPWLHGVAAGTLLAAAALTTPRTFPFLFGLVLASLVEFTRTSELTRQLRILCVAAVGTLAGIMLAWTTISSGSPLAWLRFMSYVATHENTDVALLPSASMRDLMFTWWQSIMLVFSIAGAIVAAYLVRGRDLTPHAVAGSFALVTTWTTLVVTMTLFNYTFCFGMYFVLPLTTVVIAMPTPLSDIRRRGAALVAVLLFGLLLTVRTGKLLHAAITWDGRDLSRIDRLVADHVPPGSRVLGPQNDYFFPVEAAGSRYLAVPQVSLADWSRWVRPRRPGDPPPPVPTGAYLLWPAAEPVPPEVACAIDHRVASSPAPPANIERLQWIAASDPFAVYPETVLYALSGRCGL